MKHFVPSSLRILVLAVLPALAGTSALAQTGAPVTAPPVQAAPATSSGRPDKAIERIRTEDAGTRIDEVRVGGETQSITVQPKTGSNIPSYEVRPSDSTRGSAPSSSSNETTGPRVWNVLKF